MFCREKHVELFKSLSWDTESKEGSRPAAESLSTPAMAGSGKRLSIKRTGKHSNASCISSERKEDGEDWEE